MRRALVLLALLLAPALHAATTLRGGSFATIERPAALPANAEEWEAFLSLDGGAYYAFRITPHLDVARRTFTWVVPNVDTTRARILIRAGDERTETLIEVPATFAIVRDARAEAPHTTVVPSMPGEAAREGDPGVVAWTDGDRAGGGLVQRSAVSHRTSVAALHVRGEHTDVAIAHGGGFLVLSSWFLVEGIQTKNQELRTKNQRNLAPLDILLQTSRLNI
jgi:hypothetical protein